MGASQHLQKVWAHKGQSCIGKGRGQPHLQKVWAHKWQSCIGKGRSQPAIPHKLPAGILCSMRRGKWTGDICSLAVVVGSIEGKGVHHLYPVLLLWTKPAEALQHMASLFISHMHS